MLTVSISTVKECIKRPDNALGNMYFICKLPKINEYEVMKLQINSLCNMVF